LHAGADVIHPAPGSQGRPSFTSLVGNVDGDVAKYVAASRVQTSKQEMIDDLEDMAKVCARGGASGRVLTRFRPQNILQSYLGYRKQADKVANPAPKRIIFYRGTFRSRTYDPKLTCLQMVYPKASSSRCSSSNSRASKVRRLSLVLCSRLTPAAAACAALKINPKITVVVVGKRHHVRFFPENQSQADRSGNCIAGTVVDTDVAHPVEFDFYLQSHGGLLGTSRPSHYSVLYDENNFGPDALQQLSFALCHVYARATRSVSIPAPVYCTYTLLPLPSLAP
jgi:eukaryotic translation initiation factor 2C